MNTDEAIKYIEDQGWSTMKPGLSRTHELLKALGDPQDSLKFIHVAGSNGKGSACAMLEMILRKAGYITGLYTSPYIEEFSERIRVNGENIPDGKLSALAERVKNIADGMIDTPSQFEIVTAMAMEYFRSERCDMVVLEVGMGGEYDSTNVIKAPEMAVITNIGLEHTEYLGNTLEEIAATKAGIIKTGTHAVCYDGVPEVTAVIRDICGQRNVPLAVADFGRITPVSQNADGQVFDWTAPAGEPAGDDKVRYRLSLLGAHQLKNAATVLTSIEVLRGLGRDISKDAVYEGLAQVVWPARMEVMGKKPLFILDGAHNPQCVEALTDSLKEILPFGYGKGVEGKITFIMGVMADKDYESMLSMLIPLAKEFYCLTPDNERALPGDELAACIRTRGVDATAYDSVEDAIKAAFESAGTDGIIVSLGSLYLAGTVRGAYKKLCIPR